MSHPVPVPASKLQMGCKMLQATKSQACSPYLSGVKFGDKGFIPAFFYNLGLIIAVLLLLAVGFWRDPVWC